MKISTVCLPLRFKRDETFEGSNVTVSGFGNEFKNGSDMPHIPEGILKSKFHFVPYKTRFHV